jgi:hypothetical protein
MVTILAVADFRNSDSWNQARFVVCTILAFTESWSRRIEYRSLAKSIEHLSIAVLDNIVKGYEGIGNRTFLARAGQTIDQLEQELSRVQRMGALKTADSIQLKTNLDSVKASLQLSNLNFPTTP